MGRISMKPFNLEEYRKDLSKKIVTRNGKPAKILCTNFVSNRPIIAEIDELGGYSLAYNSDGMHADFQSPHDLFFDTEKYERWINIYRDTTGVSSGEVLYDSREEAEEVGKICKYYVATVKVEWEE